MDALLSTWFFVNIGWMAAHELDAIRQHEWRIFPVVAALPDAMGYRVFVLAHVPLFAVLIALANDATFQTGFNAFMVVHVGLHWLYRKHPHNGFNNAFSQVLIGGGGLLGGLHVLVSSW